MPAARTTTKGTVKTAKEPALKKAKKVTLDDVWATINEIGKAHKETEAAIRETQAALKKAHAESEAAIKETRAALKEAHAETEAAIKETQKAHAETEAALKETQKAHAETEAALKETQRIVGDLGNKFGDEAEHTLIPGLPEKFKQFGFDFGAISRNRKIKNEKHNIHAEIDAFLENGTQAMAVEVKAKLQKGDVDNHIRRMEKLRRYADLYGDVREYFGAMAATVVNEGEREYALERGFYVIEPSGEDVKVSEPDSAPRAW
ncbi:MAG: hypothetical protein LBR93_08035 [Treponema sp.]|nr:hypothetical protein [Treponema sp.]